MNNASSSRLAARRAAWPLAARDANDRICQRGFAAGPIMNGSVAEGGNDGRSVAFSRTLPPRSASTLWRNASMRLMTLAGFECDDAGRRLRQAGRP
jgi:hypothetical protein